MATEHLHTILLLSLDALIESGLDTRVTEVKTESNVFCFYIMGIWNQPYLLYPINYTHAGVDRHICR